MLDVMLVSPSSVVAKEKASSVVLPGESGYLDLRENHTEFLTQMTSGLVTVKTDKGEKNFFVSGGYAQVKENKLILLADIAEACEHIDIERAKSSAKRAEERLANTKDSSTDIVRALASLKRAQDRQAAVGRSKILS